MVKSKICQVCGREYFRQYCEFCNRSNKWEKLIYPKLLDKLTPRIKSIIGQYENTMYDARKQGYFLFGPVGSGKTILAAKILLTTLKNAYVDTGLNLTWAFISVPDLFLDIRSSFEDGQELSEKQLIEKYSQLNLLVLDDLGVEKVSQWVYQVLYLIINNRYENMKPIIITSNYTLPDLVKHLNDRRITSRIKETCLLVSLENEDLRHYEEAK